MRASLCSARRGARRAEFLKAGNMHKNRSKILYKLTNPKFELYLDKHGTYRFRLKARNGEIIAVSEVYNAKAGCLNGIDSVRKNAHHAEITEE